MPLVVPLVVLVTRRVWALNEAAATRGLESPLRRPLRVPQMSERDYLLLGLAALLLAGVLACR